MAGSTEFHEHIEYLAMFANGLFSHDRVMPEDRDHDRVWGTASPRPPGRDLNWLLAISQVGQFVLFAARLFEKIGFEGQVMYRIDLHHVAGRILYSSDPLRDLNWPRRCSQDQIVVERTIDTAVLRADITGEAIRILKRIFALFQWVDPSEEMLAHDLQNLYARRL